MPDLKSKNILFSILSIILVFILCFLAGEVVIRVNLKLNDRQRNIWIPHPILGFVHSANNKFKWIDHIGNEFSVWHQTNKWGLIGGEIILPKPDDVYRIVVMGDSFTEALQIEKGKSYVRRLEKFLNEKGSFPGMRVEVINAGVSGYAPIMHYLHYKERLRSLEADFVIMQMWTNDIFEDNKVGAMSLLDEKGLPVRISRYFTRKFASYTQTDPERLRELSSLEKLNIRLVELSRFYEYLYTSSVKFNKNRSPNKDKILQDEYNDAYQFFMADKDSQLYKNPKLRRKMLGNTRKYLLALRHLVEQDGAKMMTMYIPMEAQLSLKKYGSHTTMYMSKQGDLIFNEFLSKTCDETQMMCLDLLNDFEESRDLGLYLEYDGHLNDVGHLVVAHSLNNYLFQHWSEIIK